MTTLTPQFFDTFIVVVILIGLALAAVRLYRDFTCPLPRRDDAMIMSPNPVPANLPEEEHPNS